MWKASLLRPHKNTQPQELAKSEINNEVSRHYDVEITGKNVPEKIQKFEFCIGKRLMKNVSKLNFKLPTPIQNYAIPIILSGKDLLVSMKSNTGKKVAYMLPIIQKLLMEPRKLIKDEYHCEPQVIIVTPDHEKAMRIKITLHKLTESTDISIFLYYGRTLLNNFLLSKGLHILVATPDGLYDLIKLGVITFLSVRFLVLDEIDVLSGSFKSNTHKIMTHPSMPPIILRQTIVLSSTLSLIVHNFAKCFLNTNYIYLTNKIFTCTLKDIKNHVFNVKKYEKLKLLTAILKLESKRTIVFVKTKWFTDFLATYLCDISIPSTSIHRARSFYLKQEALNDFNEGKINVIVTTSTGLKYLGIECVNHIIFFDIPQYIELYELCINSKYANFKNCATFFDTNCDEALIDSTIQTLLMSKQPIPNWLWSFQMSSINKNKYYNSTMLNDVQFMANMYMGSYFKKDVELDLD